MKTRQQGVSLVSRSVDVFRDKSDRMWGINEATDGDIFTALVGTWFVFSFKEEQVLTKTIITLGTDAPGVFGRSIHLYLSDQPRE